MAFPFYSFLAFNEEGQWGWISGIGKFWSDPFFNEQHQPTTPEDIGFIKTYVGQQSTAWERVFDNGRVLITNKDGWSHAYDAEALMTFLDNNGKVLAMYDIDRTGMRRRIS